MAARETKHIHWYVLALLFIVLATVTLLGSTRGLGYHNPADTRSPTRKLAVTSALERNNAITRFSLLCLDALTKAKPRDAITNCGLVIELDPGNVTALNLRGNAFMLSGNNARAIADFTRAIRLAPRSPDAYRFRANAYASRRRDGLALADYNSAIALDPRDPINIELRGHFYRARAEYAKAIVDFSKVIALQPRLARAWNSRCWTRVLANSKLTRALADCDRALQLDRSSAAALDSRGFVLLRMNRFRAAIASFDDALTIQPKLASSLFGRGLAKLLLHDRAAARDIAAAKFIEPGIEARFLRYGIRVRSSAPSGT